MIHDCIHGEATRDGGDQNQRTGDCAGCGRTAASRLPLSLSNTGRRGARYKGTYILADAYPQLTRRVSDRCLRAQFHIFATDTELQSRLAAEAAAKAAAAAAAAAA